MKKRIIWDWNGTLLDDLTQCVVIMNQMLAKRRLKPITVEEYKDVFTFPVKLYYEQLGFDFTKEDFQDVSVEFIDLYNKISLSCPLHRDAQETIALLSQKGVEQTVLSVMEDSLLKQMIGHHGLTRYFSHIMGATNIQAHGKIAHAELLIQKLGQNPKAVYLIGDSLHDAQVASHIGVNCILVSHGHYALDRLQQTGLPIIHHVKELIKLL